MPTKKEAPSKRELIEPTKGDKRYVQRAGFYLPTSGADCQVADECIFGFTRSM
jgi:hypothetical protein